MFCAQLIIWAIIVLLALDNLGINITALVAGLGVGGIAVALAVQTILGDLFGSLSIAFDKPFTVGDTLKLDDYEGTVEHIGIKSTRLRSVSGEQIILANADVLKSRVRNLGRMPERRALFRLHVAYDTPTAQVEQVSVLVEQAVTAEPNTRFVSCLLAQLGSYAMEFEVIYFVTNQRGVNIAQVMDAVNRGIVARFGQAGISFAYPTRRNI
jgi:small-conductance mechanosensitive channel